MSRLISLGLLGVLIICLGLAFFQVVQPFLLPLLLAAILAVLFQPLFRYFLRRTGDRKQIAAGLTTASILAIILLPILVGTFIGALQLYTWAATTIGNPAWESGVDRLHEQLQIDRLVERIQPYVDEKIEPEELQEQIHGNLRKLGLAVVERTFGIAATGFGLLGSVLMTLLGLGIFIIALYAFFADGTTLLIAAVNMIPIQKEQQWALLDRFVLVTRAVVTGTFAAAIAQGIATALGLACFGFAHYFFIFAIIGTFSALVPVAGTWVVWVPCVIILGTEGQWTAVVILSLYNLLVVGTLDNIIRAYVLNSDVKLHPLLAFVSVLGGLQWLGLWGVFAGPMIASCLHALVEMFNAELVSVAAETNAPGTESASTPAYAVSTAGGPPATDQPVATQQVRRRKRRSRTRKR